MSEEEKEAIETLETEGTENNYLEVKILLNLVEKQQKEIEELKEITQNYNAIGGETFGDDRIIVCSMKYFDDGFFKKNYIFKDKIREKIKKYDKWILEGGDYTESLEAQRYALKELLKEN